MDRWGKSSLILRNPRHQAGCSGGLVQVANNYIHSRALRSHSVEDERSEIVVNKLTCYFDNIMGLTPVHFFSHGSTRMLEADTEAGDHWEQCGRDALAHNVKGIIIMVGVTTIVAQTELISSRALTGLALETRLSSPATQNRANLHVHT